MSVEPQRMEIDFQVHQVGPPRWLLGCAGATAVVTIAIGVLIYRWGWVVPDVKLAPVSLPVPNAFDIYADWGTRLKNAGDIDDAYNSRDPGRAEAVCRRYRNALRAVRRAFAFESLAPPSDSLFDPYPYLRGLRRISRLFALEARAAARRGDRLWAAHSCLDAAELGGDIAPGGNILHALVGRSCAETGYAVLERLLPSISGSEAAAVLERMRRVGLERPSLASVLNSEWFQMRPVLVRAEFLHRQGELPQRQASMYPRGWMVRSYDDAMRALLIETEKPYVERRPVRRPLEPFSAGLIPVYNGTHLTWTQLEASHALLEAMLALQVYRRRQGRYPNSLADLVPDVVHALPRDPFTGAELCYRRQEPGYLLYSRGPDGVDDGGRPLPSSFMPTDRGDLVAGKIYQRQRSPGGRRR